MTKIWLVSCIGWGCVHDSAIERNRSNLSPWNIKIHQHNVIILEFVGASASPSNNWISSPCKTISYCYWQVLLLLLLVMFLLLLLLLLLLFLLLLLYSSKHWQTDLKTELTLHFSKWVRISNWSIWKQHHQNEWCSPSENVWELASPSQSLGINY